MSARWHVLLGLTWKVTAQSRDCMQISPPFFVHVTPNLAGTGGSNDLLCSSSPLPTAFTTVNRKFGDRGRKHNSDRHRSALLPPVKPNTPPDPSFPSHKEPSVQRIETFFPTLHLFAPVPRTDPRIPRLLYIPLFLHHHTPPSSLSYTPPAFHRHPTSYSLFYSSLTMRTRGRSAPSTPETTDMEVSTHARNS